MIYPKIFCELEASLCSIHISSTTLSLAFCPPLNVYQPQHFTALHNCKMVFLLLFLLQFVCHFHVVKCSAVVQVDGHSPDLKDIVPYNASTFIAKVVEALGGASALTSINGLTYSAPKSVAPSSLLHYERLMTLQQYLPQSDIDAELQPSALGQSCCI